MTVKKIANYLVILLLIAGAYLYWRHLHSGDQYYYGYYDDVNGLQSSSAVYLRGVQIGRVDDILLQENQRLKVVFMIRQGTKIPAGTIARVGSDGLTGGMAVFMKPGTGAPLPDHSVVATAVDSSMADRFHAKISPMINTGMSLLRSTDSALSNFNYIIESGWGTRTQQEIARFSVVFGNFARGSGSARQSVEGLTNGMQHAAEASADFAAKNGQISRSLADYGQKTASLSKMDVSTPLQKAGAGLSKLKAGLERLSRNKMLSDTATYHSTVRSLDTLNRSLKETREDPKGFSLFPARK